MYKDQLPTSLHEAALVVMPAGLYVRQAGIATGRWLWPIAIPILSEQGPQTAQLDRLKATALIPAQFVGFIYATAA